MMKLLLSAAACLALAATTFSASATHSEDAVKAQQPVMKIDIKSGSSGFDTMSRKCPPFC